MTGCERQQSGEIELYFYDELGAEERSNVDSHLRSCMECRRSLDELSVIRAALATRPRVDAPPGGDWTAFMERLAGECRRVTEGGDRAPVRSVAPRLVGSDPDLGDGWSERRTDPTVRPSAVNYVPYLAMAALLTLVTSGVIYVARSAPGPTRATTSVASPAVGSTPAASVDPLPAVPERSADVAFAALSEQHFERSKLVVLGLANKDAHHAREADWAYERGLASNLLSDTRVYRQAAEERGMTSLAGVMGDLELVLLQTSLADAPDAESLAQIQRLIHKRDLVTKMDVAATMAGS